MSGHLLPGGRTPRIATMTPMSAQILIVDDEPAVRDVLVTWLQAAGYRCAEAADAQTALDCITAHPVDVALLDLALPGHDGLWLAAADSSETDDVALIMVTGLQRFDAAVAGIRLGVLDYLLKPFSRTGAAAGCPPGGRVARKPADATAERDRAMQREIAERREALANDLAALDKATAGAIQALLETLHQRNPDAAAHANRVARMAVDLAHALRWSRSRWPTSSAARCCTTSARWPCPTPSLHKVGPLSEEDVTLIRTHVELGRDILRQGARSGVGGCHRGGVARSL